MTWFKNLSLRMKLVGSFLVVAILCLIVGGVGFRAIWSIQQRSEAIAQNVPVLIALGQLNTGVSDTRRTELAMVNAKVAKDEATFAARVDEYRTYVLKDHIAKGRDIYEPIKKEPAEELLWKEEVVRLQEYAAYMEKQIALMKNGQVDSARAIAIRDGRDVFIRSNEKLNLLDDMLDKESSSLEVGIGGAVTSAKYQLAAGMTAAVVVALLIGFLLNGYLTSTLALISARAQQLRSLCITNLASAIEALARGELDVRIEYGTPHLKLEQRDELGILARDVDGIITQSVNTIEAYERATATLRATVKESQLLIAAARAGALDTRADVTPFQGGFRSLVDGLNQTLDGVSIPLREAATVLQRLAERDLSARMTGHYEGDFAAMKGAINTAASNLDETLAQVQAAAEQVAAAGGQITSGSQSLAQAASEQAGSIEEVSSSLQEMAAMTKQNTDNTRIATTYAGETRDITAEGVSRMNELSAAINKIKASADQTARIVKTIDEIAFQTNLLALNAAVEAARAGDAGKGFAVVADEVRNLAMRSAEAAKTTAVLIEESVVNANGGVTMNAEVLKTLGAINSQVVKVSAVVAEIAAASEQQAKGVDQINGAVLQMNGVTQQMASGAEESASAAEELASQSSVLSDMVGQFQLSNAKHSRSNKRPAPASHAPTRAASSTPRNNGNGHGKTNGNGHASRFDAEKLLPFDDDALLNSF